MAQVSISEHLLHLVVVHPTISVSEYASFMNERMHAFLNQSIQAVTSSLYFHEITDDHLYVTDLIIGSAVQSVLQGASIRRAKALQN